jgi:phosphoribosylformylglycinamidine synthase
MPFTVLSDNDIRTLLHDLSSQDVSRLTEDLNHALTQYSCANETPYQPHRAAITRPNGQVSLFMPATTPSSIGVKLVGVAPSQNLKAGEPGLKSVLTICDERGQAIGVLNAAELTAFRTALGSMLCYRYRKVTENIVVFGAGKQAEWHIRLAILLKGQDIKKITIVNRSKQRAQELVQSLKDVVAGDFEMEVFTDDHEGGLEKLVQEADVIFCTTPSTSPLFPASYLTSDSARSKTCFISAIGSYRLDMQEIDPELLQAINTLEGPFAQQVYRASIAVDSIKGCMDEAGELVSAGVKEEQMLEVGRIDGLREGKEGSEVKKWLEEGFVVYKSVGVGVMDIGIGKALMEFAGEKGVGLRLDSF